jgi:hypothetical protein
VQFVTAAAESTQLQNRGADRGPQPRGPQRGSRAGVAKGQPGGWVVVATGSKWRDHSTAK